MTVPDYAQDEDGPVARPITGFMDARHKPRLKLPAMYTLLRARPQGHERYCWTGHIYDVSDSGMRFELDQPLKPGTSIEVRAMLPGSRHIIFNATGHVVRLHDDRDEQGPMRMGMAFDHFVRESDHERLTTYLIDSGTVSQAA